MSQPTGLDLINFLHPGHAHLAICASCGDDLRRVGITKVVYTFETCDCAEYDYTHLVEQLAHRDCFRNRSLVRQNASLRKQVEALSELPEVKTAVAQTLNQLAGDPS